MWSRGATKSVHASSDPVCTAMTRAFVQKCALTEPGEMATIRPVYRSCVCLARSQGSRRPVDFHIDPSIIREAFG